ncbi:MAG: CGNR zinc finger domain-containing protein [Rhizobiaceae bacterium]|nr:CGNR zinc finger domain-containing protein [Rhizobiaceae bacterium]
MAVLWNRHRFSGGLLVLDTTNTVVLRGDAERSFDRFAERAEIASFAETATIFRATELGGRKLFFDGSEESAGKVRQLREAADGLFRQAVRSGQLDTALFPAVLQGAAICLDGAGEMIGKEGRPFGDPATPLRFEVALGVSAISLLAGHEWRKVRICPHCNWLFVDRSRNGSRVWCDMSICGNRQKARRHYERSKAKEDEDG